MLIRRERSVVVTTQSHASGAFLVSNYHLHPGIADFISTFYEGRLNAAMADQWRHSVLLGGEAGALPPKLFLSVDHDREDT